MWEDIDVERGMLAIRRGLIRGSGGTWELGAPKTASGRRTIALDRYSHVTVGLQRDAASMAAAVEAAGKKAS